MINTMCQTLRKEYTALESKSSGFENEPDPYQMHDQTFFHMSIYHPRLFSNGML